MKELTHRDCIEKIRCLKKKWKKSLISIIDIKQYPSLWYIIIEFKYRDKIYEYREDASNTWIECERGI